jgi:hypothetical protein
MCIPQVVDVEAEMRAQLAADKVVLKSADAAPSLWRYNPPWALPFCRTNELAFELPPL